MTFFPKFSSVRRSMIKRLLLAYLALFLMFEPVLVYAQGVAGFGGTGQAVGGRRQIGRVITPGASSSFNGTANTNGFGGQGQQGPQQQGQFASPEAGAMAGMGYQIHILGQVGQPGTFRLPPSTRMDEAINTAGGIQTQGSTRQVELRRGGTVIRYDLLQFRNFGDLSQNPFLLDNDVVFVPFAEKNVSINGPVKSNGTFELSSKEKNLFDLVHLAGGFTAGVATDAPLTVVRYVDEKKQLLQAANTEQSLKDFALQNGDVVVVPHLLTEDRKFDYNINSFPADNIFYPTFNDNVFVMGSVDLPGAYPFSPNYSIRDYVSMAGPLQHAKLRDIRVFTADGKKVRQPTKKGLRISPGDTIVVPERAWTSDNVIKWYNTVANSIITGFTLRELIRR